MMKSVAQSLYSQAGRNPPIPAHSVSFYPSLAIEILWNGEPLSRVRFVALKTALLTGLTDRLGVKSR
jgi:hypothetical protein